MTGEFDPKVPVRASTQQQQQPLLGPPPQLHQPQGPPPSLLAPPAVPPLALSRPTEPRLSPLMNQPLDSKSDFESQTPVCRLDSCFDLPATVDMRYNNEDASISSLNLDNSNHHLTLPSGYTTQLSSATTGFSPNNNSYCSPNQGVYSGLALSSFRPATHTSSVGMSAQARGPQLPNLQSSESYNTRHIYGGPTPSYGRLNEQTRSAPFAPAHSRRPTQPLSPTPSPHIGFTNPARMESSNFGKGQGSTIPPLLSQTSHGRLVSLDNRTPVEPEIHGTIDKGFFLSDGEWTCYRRNYFSCVCSYSLEPAYAPQMLNFIPNGQNPVSYQVYGFAMSISAIVSESDSQQIDLVQHTPKRDKGPTAKPERVPLNPRQHQQPAHPLHVYSSGHHALGGPRMYDAGFPQGAQGQSLQAEHTFERIQFKQATANNGKRRAAQQYYHLIIELYVDVTGQPNENQYMKIAHRKSAKMIVRGRSPGHYQSDRRGSTGSGPGSASGMGSYSASSHVLGTDYPGGSSLMQTPYGGTGYHDPRSGSYGPARHHDLHVPMEPVLSSAEEDAISNTKGYQYYPATIYETPDPPKDKSSDVKHEFDGSRSNQMYTPGAAYYSNSCHRFEGKPSSAGYYPAMLSQSS